MQVSIDRLHLNEFELMILRRMAKTKIDIGKRLLTLNCSIFPNRIENKRYLVYQLELLLSEARRLAILAKTENK